jgi:hypothetical protein
MSTPRLEDAKKLVMGAWKDVWAAGSLHEMAVELQNRKFERPKNAVWGRLSFLPGKRSPVSLGPGKTYRTPFALILQVFHPEDTGTTESAKASDIMGKLDDTDVRSNDGGIRVSFGTASLDAVGKVDGFEAFNVTLTGFFDNYTADG